MQPISSLQNPRIKQIRALRARRQRDESGLYYVDGVQLVAAAAEHSVDLELLVVAPELLRSALGRATAQRLARDAPSIEVTSAVFAALAGRDDLQGLGAVMRQRWAALAELPDDGRCVVALDGVQYPGNLGTIIRTCDAVGGAGVVLLGPTADPYDPAAVRASTGAVFGQRLVRAAPGELGGWLRRRGAQLVGAAPDGPTDYRALRYREPLVLALGSEARGLSPAVRALCDATVHIPMVGSADSLNLAIAAGLVLYEVFRQRAPLERARGAARSPPEELR